MRAAVLFGSAREIGAPRELGAAGPQQVAAGFDLWCEHLILEIAVCQTDLVHQLRDPLGLFHIARQRLFTRDALELSLPALDGAHHLLDVLDARVIRTG